MFAGFRKSQSEPGSSADAHRVLSVSTAESLLSPLRQITSWGLLCSTLALFAGCLSGSSSDDSLDVGEATEVNDRDSLKTRLDQVLDYTLQERMLSIEEHAAWQILHGALAYQEEFPVRVGDQTVSAVGHILNGGSMEGWTVRPGRILDPESDRRGLIAVMEPGSKTGQGHHDQWLAILAQCGLPLDQEILTDERTYTVRDYVEQVQWDVPRNLDQEFSWTLIGLTTYLPTDAKWTASDGKEWSIERLLESEVSNPIGEGACGGTHRLIGITMALQRHIDQGRAVEGVWAEAQQTINEAVELARRHQNPDGTFSTNYVTLAGSSPDLAQNLGSTGHVLEFLSLALSPEQLEHDWVRRAAGAMCNIFERTEGVPLECGGLYHAAHGLVLYREKVFGPRAYLYGS